MTDAVISSLRGKVLEKPVRKQSHLSQVTKGGKPVPTAAGGRDGGLDPVQQQSAYAEHQGSREQPRHPAGPYRVSRNWTPSLDLASFYSSSQSLAEKTQPSLYKPKLGCTPASIKICIILKG